MTHKRVKEMTPGTNPALSEIEARIIKERGKISPLYRTLLNSAPIAKGWESLITAVRNQSSLPTRLIEIMILRVAYLNQSDYEFEAHRLPATQAGLSAQQIDALKTQAFAAEFSDIENLLIHASDCITQDVELPDPLFERIAEHFNDQEKLEIITTISAYNMVSRFLKALKISY